MGYGEAVQERGLLTPKPRQFVPGRAQARQSEPGDEMDRRGYAMPVPLC